MNSGAIRVSTVQLESSTEKDKNLEKVKKYAEIANKNSSDLLVFPEGFMFYSSPDEPLEKYLSKAEFINDNFVNSVKKISKEYSIPIIIGMHEKIKEVKRAYNTVIGVYDDQIFLTYRKTHLYDAFGFRESDKTYASNNNFQTFKLKDFVFGVMVCYEVRFPEIARTLTLDGAEVIVIPSAWVKGYNKEENWFTLIKARAMENTVYLVTSNQIGNIFTGIASIVDPIGVILNRCSEEECIITSDLYKERIKKVRDVLPLLNQRRTDLYKLD